MTASKRDFKDFHSFPGEIDEGTGYYSFPVLYHKDDKNRLRTWELNIRLIKANKKKLSGVDWDLFAEIQIPIKEEYFDSDECVDLEGDAVQVWTETGIEGGKITRNSPSYFDESVLEDNTNKRNAFQQALIYGRNLFLLRKNKGGSVRRPPLKDAKVSNNVMYFPMLAKPFADGEKHLKYPLYLQPKLDGVRCLVYLKKKNGGIDNVVIYSRAKKEYPAMDYLKKALYTHLNDLFDEENNQSIYLDGELYKHGKRLQDISGESRNENKRPETDKIADINEYHIYDCFYPKELDTAFSDRKAQLDNLFSAIGKSPIVKRVETFEADNMEEVVKYFNKLTADKYEGVILRNMDGAYLANAQKTGAFMRSKNLVKMKKRYTDEFEIINYAQGKRGKDVGAIIWVAKTTDGVEFNITPKDMSYEERYTIYSSCKKLFNKLYKSRMMTVEYEDLSKNGVPLRAKALTFRDYE